MTPKLLKGNNFGFAFFPDEEDTIISRSESAIVYIGQCIDTKQKVVLKKMPTAVFGNDAQRFKFFLAVCSEARHDNIMKVMDIIFEDQYLYLACEYINGRTLKELIADSRYFDCRYNEFFLKIISKTLETLSFLHALKLCHTNLKPENIIVEYDENEDFDFDNPSIKIISLESIKLGFKEMSLAKNMRNVIYASPEQLLGFDDIVGDYSDTFSMGIILYEALAKEPTVDVSMPMAIRRAQIFGEIKPHYRINNDILEIIRKATVKPLAFTPAKVIIEEQKIAVIQALNKRYQSILAFKQDLDAIIENQNWLPDVE